jgi:hypothetical protein
VALPCWRTALWRVASSLNGSGSCLLTSEGYAFYVAVRGTA